MRFPRHVCTDEEQDEGEPLLAPPFLLGEERMGLGYESADGLGGVARLRVGTCVPNIAV